MAVLKRHHAPGMPAEVYDQVVGDVKASQSAADGFVAHYGVVEDGGITVVEIWDSIGQHDAWFNEAVKPLLPPGTPEPTFVELHFSNTISRADPREPFLTPKPARALLHGTDEKRSR